MVLTSVLITLFSQLLCRNEALHVSIHRQSWADRAFNAACHRRASAEFVHHPKADKLQEPSDAETALMVPVHLNDYSLTIMTYPSKEDEVSSTLQTKGAWDAADVEMFCQQFAKYGGRGNFVDVGANIGSYTLPLAMCASEHGAKGKASVLSVEANPRNLNHLRASIRRNKMANVKLYGYAVGSPEMGDDVRFSDWRPGNHGMGQVGEHRDFKGNCPSIVVPATTLDAIFEAERRTMQSIFAMKIDIEGYDFYALQGAQHLFEKYPPCMVKHEVYKSYVHSLNTTFVPFMEERGYVLRNDLISNGGKKDNFLWQQRDMESCIARL